MERKIKRDTKARQNSKTGVLGVTYVKSRDFIPTSSFIPYCYKVQITVNKDRHFIGYYPTVELAKEARKNAEIKYYGKTAEEEDIPSGISYDSTKESWKVSLKFNGKYKHFGYFKDIEDAKTKRKQILNYENYIKLEIIKNLFPKDLLNIIESYLF